MTQSRLQQTNMIGMDVIVIDNQTDAKPEQKETVDNTPSSWTINVDTNLVVTLILGVIVIVLVIVLPKVNNNNIILY